MFSRCGGLGIKEKDHLAGNLFYDDGGGVYDGSDYDGDDDDEVWFILLFKADAQWLPQYSIKQLCKCFSKLDSGRV